MEDWEVVADKLKQRGWSLGWVSAVDSEGRTIWVADAHRVDGNRFIVRPGPPGRPKSDGNNDDGGDGMTVLRNTDSRVTGSNTPRRDNTRIRNGDSRRRRPVQSQFPEFREFQ
jgi:hypothetical protein